MNPRRAVALLGALSTLGCADMLGLGGLTFEPEATGGAPASAGGAGGTTEGSGGSSLGSGGQPVITIGSGGAPAPPPEFADDYPVTWPRGAVIGATWPGLGPYALAENSNFWVYDPATGTLTSHQLDLFLEDELGSTSVSPHWDLLYAPTFGGSSWLFGYATPTGLVEFGLAPLASEAFEAETRAGSPGWTHLLLAGDPTDPFLIAADNATRLVRIGPADPNAEDPLVTSVTWDTDFTQLLAYQRDGTDGLLRLDSVLGEVNFVPIEGGVLGEAVELEFNVPPGWSLAATYPHASEVGLLIYRAADGAVETYFPGSTDSYETALWRRDLSAIVPVSGEGEAWAITYDASTGVADLGDLSPLEPVVVVK